jgi:hypothetical protein
MMHVCLGSQSFNLLIAPLSHHCFVISNFALQGFIPLMAYLTGFHFSSLCSPVLNSADGSSHRSLFLSQGPISRQHGRGLVSNIQLAQRTSVFFLRPNVMQSFKASFADGTSGSVANVLFFPADLFSLIA